MVQPTLISDIESRKIDTVFDTGGTPGVKLGIGDKAVAGLTPHAKWHGAATHADSDDFIAADGVSVVAGVLPGTPDTVVRLLVDATGKLQTVASPASTGLLENGWRATTGATAIALASTSIPCQGVLVKAKAANVGTLYVGKSDVTADETEATGGYPLEPGESVGIPCRNVNEVFIRGTTGDKAAWIASAD